MLYICLYVQIDNEKEKTMKEKIKWIQQFFARLRFLWSFCVWIFILYFDSSTISNIYILFYIYAIFFYYFVLFLHFELLDFILNVYFRIVASWFTDACHVLFEHSSSSSGSVVMMNYKITDACCDCVCVCLCVRESFCETSIICYVSIAFFFFI